MIFRLLLRLEHMRAKKAGSMDSRKPFVTMHLLSLAGYSSETETFETA